MLLNSLAQAKLGVAAEEFAKWRFASLTNLQAPKLLEDPDCVSTRFPKKVCAFHAFFGKINSEVNTAVFALLDSLDHLLVYDVAVGLHGLGHSLCALT